MTDTTLEDEETSLRLLEDIARRRKLREIQKEFMEYQRAEIAEILEGIAANGLPTPYSLDVALDAIQSTIYNLQSTIYE